MQFGRQHRLFEEHVLAHAAALGDAVQVLVRQKPLRQRAVRRDGEALLVRERLDAARFDRPLQDGVRHLREHEGNAQGAVTGDGGLGLLAVVVGDADVQRLAALNDLLHGLAGLLDGGIGVGAVMVEDVYIIDAEVLQAAVETGDEVLAAAVARAVRPAPGAVARLGGDDQLVAVAVQIVFEDAAEVLFGSARGGAVVVGDVEHGDAAVEGGEHHVAHVLVRVERAEVVPHAEGQGGELQPAFARAAVFHGIVPLGGGSVVVVAADKCADLFSVHSVFPRSALLRRRKIFAGRTPARIVFAYSAYIVKEKKGNVNSFLRGNLSPFKISKRAAFLFEIADARPHIHRQRWLSRRSAPAGGSRACNPM